jgi:hypothetical protein
VFIIAPKNGEKKKQKKKTDAEQWVLIPKFDTGQGKNQNECNNKIEEPRSQHEARENIFRSQHLGLAGFNIRPLEKFHEKFY